MDLLDNNSRPMARFAVLVGIQFNAYTNILNRTTEKGLTVGLPVAVNGPSGAGRLTSGDQMYDGAVDGNRQRPAWYCRQRSRQPSVDVCCLGYLRDSSQDMRVDQFMSVSY